MTGSIRRRPNRLVVFGSRRAMTPSELLTRAADLVRDAAAAATPGPWRQHDGWWPGTLGVVASVLSGEGTDTEVRSLLPTFMEEPNADARNVWADARWIALTSPALAPHLESLLRAYVPIAKQMESGEVLYHRGYQPALALARAVLGVEEAETDG